VLKGSGGKPSIQVFGGMQLTCWDFLLMFLSGEGGAAAAGEGGGAAETTTSSSYEGGSSYDNTYSEEPQQENYEAPQEDEYGGEAAEGEGDGY
jgi:hypothetical protein